MSVPGELGERRWSSVLRGRRDECEVLDGLVGAVRAGESRVLVVRGEPGVGKTALLRYLVERASGFRVLRAALPVIVPPDGPAKGARSG